jgi:hypothetical protein
MKSSDSKSRMHADSDEISSEALLNATQEKFGTLEGSYRAMKAENVGLMIDNTVKALDIMNLSKKNAGLIREFQDAYERVDVLKQEIEKFKRFHQPR